MWCHVVSFEQCMGTVMIKSFNSLNDIKCKNTSQAYFMDAMATFTASSRRVSVLCVTFFIFSLLP